MLSSCGGGESDIIVHLGNGYFYNGEGAPFNTIFYGKKSENGYTIEKNIIYSNVKDYIYNDKYILVLQEPDYNANLNFVMFEKISEPFYNEEQRESQEQKADSILKNDSYWQKVFANKINYYIINKNKRKVYGPFTKLEYASERKQLDIPTDLTLERD